MRSAVNRRLLVRLGVAPILAPGRGRGGPEFDEIVSEALTPTLQVGFPRIEPLTPVFVLRLHDQMYMGMRAVLALLVRVQSHDVAMLVREFLTREFPHRLEHLLR